MPCLPPLLNYKAQVVFPFSFTYRGKHYDVNLKVFSMFIIANQEINTKDIHAFCGVRGKPVFDTIPLKHFITLVLHLTKGKGNNVLDIFVAELQAATEGYTNNYYAAEKAEVITKIAQEHAKEELASFNMVMSEYEKDLK
jgi:hypothetical protein